MGELAFGVAQGPGHRLYIRPIVDLDVLADPTADAQTNPAPHQPGRQHLGLIDRL
jgi:hypothetical protein